MSTVNNSLIRALKCLVDVTGKLKIGSRSQLNPMELTAIKMYCGQAVKFLSADCIPETFMATAGLANIMEIIDMTVNKPGFKETQNEVKEFIVNKMMSAVNSLTLVVGRVYTDQEFTVSIEAIGFYKEIVDICIEHGYYFGLEEEFK